MLVTVWLRGRTTIEEVLSVLTLSLDGRLDRERVERTVERALADGTLVEAQDGCLKASEEQSEALRLELADVTASEQRVYARLIALVQIAGIDADDAALWDDFEDMFMHPLVKAAGARIYEVLTSTADINVAVPTYRQIVEPLCQKYGTEMRELLVEFLNPEDSDVRNYVLRTLNADFVREAAGMEASSLDALKARAGPPAGIQVFVDTNFLFSFLRLHDNPANDVAADLVQVAERASSSIRVEFLVLPITVEETRRVLRSVMFRLSGVIPGPRIAAAARDVTSTGLVTRYFEAAAQAGMSGLTPDAFFGPYESDLATILRERGVEILDVDLESLRIDSEVIDDLHDQELVQRQRRRLGPKPYEANLHDMVLWHFAHERRRSPGASPIGLQTWVCTVDFGLISFDRRKVRGTDEAPVCFSPSTFIQLLQFWIPRSEALDKALVGAIREPLLFLDFDASTEQTTIRILRTISRFEGINDLSVPTIYNVLTNDALRARLADSPNASTAVEVSLIEAAIIEEAQRLESDLATARDEGTRIADDARQAVASRDQKVEQLRTDLDQRQRQVTDLSSEIDRLKSLHLEEQEKHLQGANEMLASQALLEESVRRLAEEATAKEEWLRERRSVTVAFLAVTLATGAATVLAGFGLSGRLPGGAWVAWLCVAIAAVLAWSLICGLVLQAKASMRDGKLAYLLRRSRCWVIGTFVAVWGSVLASAIWESIKSG